MLYNDLHNWELTPREAVKLQRTLQCGVSLTPFPIKKVRFIAGVDVSVKNNISRAAIVILEFGSFKIVEIRSHAITTPFPYIPGLLSFREGKVILECAKKIRSEPDVLIFDGQGMAHPRRMGIACHMGLFFNKPSIGSAKSHLYGTYDPPGPEKGAYSIIKDKDDTPLGAALTTRKGIKPVFVSPGHLMDIPSAIEIILACCPKYKLPEPIRAAHNSCKL